MDTQQETASLADVTQLPSTPTGQEGERHHEHPEFPILCALQTTAQKITDVLKQRPLHHKLKKHYKLVKSFHAHTRKAGLLHTLADVASSAVATATSTVATATSTVATTSTSSSASAYGTSDATTTATETCGTKRALIIGINYAGSSCELRGCINDAMNVYTALTTYYGYEDHNIHLLTDARKKHTIQATRKNIITYIRKVVSWTRPGDTLFVHYSGHGSQVVCVDGDEDHNEDTPGMDDVIVPCDFESAYTDDKGLITDDELRKELVEPLPKGAKLRVLFDCCCSGTALDLPFVYKHGDKYMRDHNIILQCDDCLLISGCRDDQTSADAFIHGQFNGALTWGFLKALQRSRKMQMTWKELFFLIRMYLAKEKYEQIPALSVGEVYVGGETVDM